MVSPELRPAPGVMWLLNHPTLRRFEVDQLRRAGVRRIFTPKRFPYDEENLSASVDYSLDADLDLPADDLALLNAQDWYSCEDPGAWAIANRYFRIAFVGFVPRQIETVLHHFDGAVVIRVLGRVTGTSYSALMRAQLSLRTRIRLRERAAHVWFAGAHASLVEAEAQFFADRYCNLPAGLDGHRTADHWTGVDPRVLFVCPRIGSSSYYRAEYDRFKSRFADVPHVIGGAQPIAVEDPAVIGFVPEAEYERILCELRVMYYPGAERTRACYHPLEAILRGMPLVFMSGGLLDRLGGRSLPGRCRSVEEARKKVRRVLDNDLRLIDRIRTTQRILLEPVLGENCAALWQRSYARIAQSVEGPPVAAARLVRGSRIAVLVPVAHRGGRLRRAKLLARAIEAGSREAGEPAEVVFGHLDEESLYTAADFTDLPASIARRPFRWKTLSREEAQRALAYAGVDADLDASSYAVPDDGATQFDDCDLWLFASDRLFIPLLPVKSYVMAVDGYVQRYEAGIDAATNAAFMSAEHGAERVLVTSDFSYADARDFAGLPLRKVRRVPMLLPALAVLPEDVDPAAEPAAAPYFVWTTNLEPQRNHANAARALRIYYEDLDGHWLCKVTGIDSEQLRSSDLPYVKCMREQHSASRRLRRNVVFVGLLPDQAYLRLLAGAGFVWHAGRVDDGTLSVVDAANVGVPALSSDYPAMREIAVANELAIAWMDPHDPEQMAAQLKRMEVLAAQLRVRVPRREVLARNSAEQCGLRYWNEVRTCL